MSVITAIPSAYYSDYTQKIVNKFPEWHVARRQRDSVISRFIDSTYGRTISHLVNTESYNLYSQRVISQALPFSPDKAFSVDVSDVQTTTKQDNLLKNTNFSYWSNINRPPDFWLVTNVTNPGECDLVSVQIGSNYVGGHSILMNTGTGYGEVKMYQIYELSDEDPNTVFSLSVFNRRLGGEPIPSGYFYLYALITFEDGSVTTQTTPLVDNLGWIKTRLKIEASGKIQSIECGIKFDSDIVVDLSTLQLDGFQLLSGDVNQFWAKHVEDRPEFIDQDQSGINVSISAPNADYVQYLTKIKEEDINKQLLPNSAIIDFLIPEVVDWTPPEPTSIQLLPGYDFQNKQISQKLAIGSASTILKYNWPSWVNGRLVKYDGNNTDYIIATYIPSFPIKDSQYVEAIDTIKLMCITSYNNNIWVLGRILNGSGLLYASNTSLVLFCLSSDLPKQDNDMDPETNPMFIESKITYPFSKQSSNGYGLAPYGIEGFGGDGSFFTMDHYSMEFIDSYTIKTNMLNGVVSLISLRYNYFVHDETNAQIFLLRDPRIDIEDGSIVVC